MKGIILNLVEEAVVADHGDAAWDQVLERADADGAYTSLGNYDDGELIRLVHAGAALLEMSAHDLTVHLGRKATGGLARRYPQYFETHGNTRDFLLTLNDVIHPEVRKLHPDSKPPEFTFESDNDTLVVHYHSVRHLCTLAVGMMQGAGEQYGERVSVARVACVDDGADRCTFRCTFESDADSAPRVAGAVG